VNARPGQPPWRVSVAPTGPRAGAELLVHVLNCQRLYRALTRAQRAALLAAADGRLVGTHPRVVAALVGHGLADEDGVLTEAGAEIRFWNLPADHPERVAYRQADTERGMQP